MLTEQDLRMFSGSENWYKHLTGMLYTEGVKYMAEAGGAYWLIDEIGFAQKNPKIRNNPRLREFQLWKLEVRTQQGGNCAVLACREDSNVPPAFTKNIPFTDFPLKGIQLYVEAGSIDGETEAMIMMLPSER